MMYVARKRRRVGKPGAARVWLSPLARCSAVPTRSGPACFFDAWARRCVVRVVKSEFFARAFAHPTLLSIKGIALS